MRRSRDASTSTGPVRGCLCPRLVQADPPRHGAGRALPRQAGAKGNADLAGPDPRRRSPADRRAGHRGPEGEDPRVRPVRFRTGLDRLGIGLDVPRLRQARRRQWCAHSPRPAEGLARQQSARAGKSPLEARSDPEGGRQESVARRSDRARRQRRGRKGGEGCRRHRDGPVHGRPHRRIAGADRRRLLRSARTACRRLPQLHRPQAPVHACRKKRWWIGRN